MSTDTTGPLEEVAIRIMDYLDGEMTDEERTTFEADLVHDNVLQRELAAMQSTLGVVQSLQMKFAPDHFVQEVESKVRTRSRGRFFGYDALYSSRIPYEVFAVVAIAIMAGMWMMSSPDDARFGADMAIVAPDPQKVAPDAGAEAGAAGGGVPDAPRVRPLKTEAIEYTFTLPAGGDLDALAKQIEATSRRYTVKRTDGELEVTVPAESLDGFLRDWSAGRTMERKTVTGRGDAKVAKVRFRTP